MNLLSTESKAILPAPDLFIHSKDGDKKIDDRKRLFNFSVIIFIIFQWQKERPILLESDKELELLVYLILLEIEEVGEIKRIEDLPGHSFKDEEGEVLDVIFILITMFRVAIASGVEVNFKEALLLANGQSTGSGSLDRMIEAMANIEEKSLGKDLKHAWTLVVSYVINMKSDLNPTKVLVNYTIPKNSGNYIKELLAGNPLFEQVHERPMNEEEKVKYFDHYKKALSIIREFAKKYINPGVKDSGIGYEFCKPYEMFIYNFFKIDITPTKALLMLREQLFIDYADEVAAAGGRKEKILIAKR